MQKQKLKRNNMNIKKLDKQNTEEALLLVRRVFNTFESPDYSEEGVEEFHRSISDKDYLAQLTVYGVFINNRITGVIASRNGGSHIALFFVEGKFHRQGIGKKLFEELLKDCRSDRITVNSSPYAVSVYKKLGFKCTDKEQTVKGIRFAPMELEIKSALAERIHTTPMGADRIKRNLKAGTDVISLCQNIIRDENCTVRREGKNWYCENGSINITVNASSYTVITAHTKKITP